MEFYASASEFYALVGFFCLNSIRYRHALIMGWVFFKYYCYLISLLMQSKGFASAINISKFNIQSDIKISVYTRIYVIIGQTYVFQKMTY